METDLLRRVRKELATAKRGRIERIADAMGVPRGTFRKIVAGTTPDPRHSTVQKISAFYRRRSVASID
jgi:predicted transcriptional regulator